MALVGAALLLSGCGGGSSDPATTKTAGSSAAAGSSSSPAGPSSGAGSPDAQARQGGAGSSGQSQAESLAAGGGADSAAPTGKGQKHGERIAAPKGPTEQAPTPAQVAHATVADMSLQSPAAIAAEGSLGRIPATYTCDGKNSWPQFHWGGVPPGTAELAFFAMNLQPVQEQIFFDWAVAGIDPGLEGIEAGQLPRGAVVGTNGFGRRGYSICPPGAGETYMFAVYALPRRLDPQKGFDPLQLRQEVLDASGNAGLLPAVYERG